jgi:23S rRNA (guanosine2251-2'-O)-methyltransferase
MGDLLYGRNSVREALRAGRRRFSGLRLAAGMRESGTLNEIVSLAERVHVPVEWVDRRALDRALREANHQGVLLDASAYPYAELEGPFERAEQQGEPILLLLLDHVQDPQNVGTLLRTAENVGVHGVVLPGRRAATITPAVVNASSGATEHLLIVQAGNLAQTIVALQRADVWVAGLENDPTAQDIDQAELDRPLALVVGAEGTGLARLTRERCDFLVRLPTRGRLDSLNAAVAGSIALYSAWRQRASDT